MGGEGRSGRRVYEKTYLTVPEPLAGLILSLALMGWPNLVVLSMSQSNSIAPKKRRKIIYVLFIYVSQK